MPLYAIMFDDHPDKRHVRDAQLAAHIEWLRERRDSILLAGSMRHPDTDAPLGGLWIVRADSPSAVESLFITDPFWIHGLRRSYTIRRWSLALDDYAVAP